MVFMVRLMDVLIESIASDGPTGPEHSASMLMPVLPVLMQEMHGEISDKKG